MEQNTSWMNLFDRNYPVLDLEDCLVPLLVVTHTSFRASDFAEATDGLSTFLIFITATFDFPNEEHVFTMLRCLYHSF